MPATVDEEVDATVREAKRSLLKERVCAWLNGADSDIKIVEQPTTRRCGGNLGNNFSNLDNDGGLVITITIPKFKAGREPIVRRGEVRDTFIVSAPCPPR